MNLPKFVVKQLAYDYPNETALERIQKLSVEMAEQGYPRGVGVLTSSQGHCLYVVYEKEHKDDNLSRDPRPPKVGP